MRLRRCLPGLFFSALLLLLLNGCGRKGPLQPLHEERPQPIQNARLLQRGDSFQLQWQLPKQNQAGARAEIDAVEVERLIASADAYCAECSDPWPRVARITPRSPAPARQVRQLFLLSDAGGASGLNVYYRLRVQNLQGYFGPALTLQQSARAPLPAPTNLSVASRDRSVELNWQAAEIPPGATLLGYQVYRRLADQPYSPLPTNLKPLQTTRFSDLGLENGLVYSYRVRSLFDFSGEQVESLPGTEVSATPNPG